MIADFLAFQRLDGENDRDVGRGAQDLAEFEGCTDVFDVDRCAVRKAEGGFIDQHGAALSLRGGNQRKHQQENEEKAASPLQPCTISHDTP